MKIKSERHHWWPECVSGLWKDKEGMTHWLLPDGQVKRMPPKNLGVIGNGHHIKLGSDGAPTPWDESFEAAFQKADENFPKVVSWLNCLDRTDYSDPPNLTSRFLHQPCSDDMLLLITEGLVSLAVRSPRTRNAAIALAERFRGSIPSAERNTIIGLNLRSLQRKTADAIGYRAKFSIVYSPEREFIFGDGFFHNILSFSNPPLSPTIFAPLTPNASVLITRPMQFSAEPRLTTIVLKEYETEQFNHIVQIYSKDKIFYRSQKPEIADAYRRNAHLEVLNGSVIDKLIYSLPGVFV